MAATGTRAKQSTRATVARVLPPITVGKFEAVGEEVERMVATNTSLFIEKGQAYRELHREGSSRPLSAQEAMELATAVAASMKLGDFTDDDLTVEQRAARFQGSELRAHEEPTATEVMAVAGVSTAPAFVKATRRVVALLELDNDTFEEKYEDGTLEVRIDEDAKKLRALDMIEGRQRAEHALDAFGRAAGQDSGKGLGLLIQSLWASLQQAGEHLTQTMSLPSLKPSSSSPASQASSDGPAGTAFTA